MRPTVQVLMRLHSKLVSMCRVATNRTSNLCIMMSMCFCILICLTKIVLFSVVESTYYEITALASMDIKSEHGIYALEEVIP